jgi:hypothetical protein
MTQDTLTLSQWTSKEHDDVQYALEDMLELFYRRPPGERLVNIWIKTLHDLPADVLVEILQQALTQYHTCPKPEEIRKQVVTRDTMRKPAEQTNQDLLGNVDPTTRSAWIIALRHMHGFSLENSKATVTLTIEEAMLIANREAKRFNRPDAIPDEYKDPAIWG